MKTAGRYERFYSIIRRIPKGHVATYGQVAALAGYPGHARQVGYALYALRAGTSVPWHRVVNASGGLSVGAVIPEGDVEQRIMLEVEGVEFDAEGRIDLARFRWTPFGARAARREGDVAATIRHRSAAARGGWRRPRRAERREPASAGGRNAAPSKR